MKNANELLTILLDIVNKNGCLLLDVPPNENGEIIEYIQNTLLDMGKWLKTNGEAVYNTRPWKIYGEGPTKLPKSNGGFNEVKGFRYNSKDIRYTRTKNKKTIYASILAWPGENSMVLLKAFSKLMLSKIIMAKKISMLDYDGEIEWKQSDEGIVVIMPQIKIHDIVVIKIETNCDVMDVEVKCDFVLESINEN